jgi:hypothetical protein
MNYKNCKIYGVEKDMYELEDLVSGRLRRRGMESVFIPIHTCSSNAMTFGMIQMHIPTESRNIRPSNHLQQVPSPQ